MAESHSVLSQLASVDAEWRRSCREDPLVSRGRQPPDPSDLPEALWAESNADDPGADIARLAHAAQGLTGNDLSVDQAIRQLFIIGQVMARQLPLEHPPWFVRGLGQGAEAVALVYVRGAEEVAGTDELTGLPNGRTLKDDLNAAIRRADNGSVPVVVAALDLDGLKVANDEFGGHGVGDRYIRRFGSDLAAAVRPLGGRAFRPHGDEFCVLFTGATRPEVEEVLANFRAREDVAPFCYGVAASPDDGMEPDDIVFVADQDRLYAMKGQRSPEARAAGARSWLGSGHWDTEPSAESSSGQEI